MSVTVAKRLTKMSGWCALYPGGFASAHTLGNCHCKSQSRFLGFASAVEFGMTRRWSSDRGAVELVDRCRGNSGEKR